MNQKWIVILMAAIGLLAVAAFVLTFSPLSKNLFGSSGETDIVDDALGLLFGILILFGSVAMVVTWIVACCYLGKRLGYDLYAGLLLIVPVVNVFVFCYWAFKESPNERKLRRMRSTKRDGMRGQTTVCPS
ncbi:hypothetical protein [Aporhodopirellula aestuarii]|uniref:Transmembrane protein n=1 Tax=Aporhodopirellula aestuarii TaxID=2950107 RepID=A0ABT0U7E5_9BACT|nr:hypothetical protein [Aporhodopirellula aestuarii]MCM2372338.1 hypothetical protein [Aporhodopirellula aestuarii]